MRTALVLLLCLLTGACSSISDRPTFEVGQQPDQVELEKGIRGGIKDSHFEKPIEVTDVVRAPAISLNPWMVCIRGAASDEARRLTYSVFYGRNYPIAKDGQYMLSRQSVYNDDCASQSYHSYQEPLPAPSANSQSASTPDAEKRKRHSTPNGSQVR
jgi:hypothetical protein